MNIYIHTPIHAALCASWTLVVAHPMRGAWTAYTSAAKAYPLRTNMVYACSTQGRQIFLVSSIQH